MFTSRPVSTAPADRDEQAERNQGPGVIVPFSQCRVHSYEPSPQLEMLTRAWDPAWLPVFLGVKLGWVFVVR